MPAAIRFLDLTIGHCFQPYPLITASGNTYYNSRGAGRIGDKYPTHCCSNKCHTGVQAQGSPNVFVNGRAQARVADAVTCGDHAGGTASPNVFIN